MALKTPGIGMSGSFEIRAPFTVSNNKLYTVEGHRTFNEIIASGEDPIEMIYMPAYGEEEAAKNSYRADAVTPGVLVVILVSTNGQRVLVPNTYIEEYPNTSIVPHNWVVGAVSLGILPKDYDLVRVSDAIKRAVSDFIGVEPNVYFTRKATHDVVTEDLAAQLAVIRQQAIVHRSTDYVEKIALQQENAALRQEIDDLIAIIDSLNNP